MFNRKGFTLVELMIVVAIIGILAAIAIPNFIAMQYRAKRAEVPANVDGIKTAELAYDAAFDGFQAQGTPLPDGDVGKEQQEWPANGQGFDTIGWRPDGAVRGAYSVTATDTDFTVTGICDVDADGTQATYTSTKSVNATLKNNANDTY